MNKRSIPAKTKLEPPIGTPKVVTTVAAIRPPDLSELTLPYILKAEEMARVTRVAWEVITPAIAATMLALNQGNRNPKEKHQKKLVRDILSDAFVPNGQTIIFSENRLLDGQNRLMAVVKADRPIVSLVVRNVPNAAFESLDQVTPRSIVDKLNSLKIENARTVSGAITILWRFDSGLWPLASHWQMYPTVHEVTETLESSPALLESIARFGKAKSRHLPVGSICAMHTICSRFDQEAADDFFHRLVHGTGIEEGSPLHLLRRRFESNASEKAKLSPMDQCVLITKAWNAMREGKPIRQLKQRRRQEEDKTGSECVPLPR